MGTGSLARPLGLPLTPCRPCQVYFRLPRIHPQKLLGGQILGSQCRGPGEP